MTYEFIDEYFKQLDSSQFKSSSEQWQAWETFVDMLCMISLVRREKKPDTSQTLIGSAFEDEELIAALEPRNIEPFPEWEKVRKIFMTLVEKGEIRDMEDIPLPLWQFINTGMMAPIEIMAFVMAALVDRNRKYVRIFNRLMGETGNGYPSVGLVHDLCLLFLNDVECDYSILYDETSILNRIFTVKAETEGRISKHFCLEQIIIKRLSGETSAQLGEMSPYMKIIDAENTAFSNESFIHESELDKLLVAYAAALETDDMVSIFELIGKKGIGKKYLLSRFAEISDRDILCVDIEKLLDEPDEKLFSALKNIVVMAMCELKIIYLENISGEPGSAAKERFCISFLQSYLKQLIIGCEKDVAENLACSGIVYRINIEMVRGIEANKELWLDFANRLMLNIDDYVDELVLKYSLTPGDMWQVISCASMEAIYEENEGYLIVPKDIVERHIREKSRVDFGGSATRLESKFTVSDLQLTDIAKEQFTEAIARAMNRNIVNDDFGFSSKLPYGKGLCVLLYGPPGTGKTMAAGVFGNELGLDVYRVDLSQINSKYIGETEKNLENVFRVARDANMILFFDEADALFAKRTEVSGSNDKYSNSQTAYLLQKIEEYDGICILATNGVQNFDAAFKRRMTYMISIERPDMNVRLKLWQSVFPKEAPLSDDVDFEAIARIDSLTGAQIKSAALTAAYRAAARKQMIQQDDIIEGIEREYVKDGRLDFSNIHNALMY